MSSEAEWRVEQITQIAENFLSMGDGQKDPSQWAMFAMGQVMGILDLSDEQVKGRMS